MKAVRTTMDYFKLIVTMDSRNQNKSFTKLCIPNIFPLPIDKIYPLQLKKS